ncbi:unnamed protein product [Lactuca virosa]|uniref:Uncharacterized protein n=1 Tax=Lactuca virosa TaxID=75947 RepID=A0AAU9LIG1_9ASTR|nr:unnamed protein product [Lactuca virosa]
MRLAEDDRIDEHGNKNIKAFERDNLLGYWHLFRPKRGKMFNILHPQEANKEHKEEDGQAKVVEHVTFQGWSTIT